jgi:hypothetical protein
MIMQTFIRWLTDVMHSASDIETQLSERQVEVRSIASISDREKETRLDFRRSHKVSCAWRK